MLTDGARGRGFEAHRLARLMLRLLVLTAIFLVPLVLYTGVKRNFAFAKFMTLRYLVLGALLVWAGSMRSRRELRSPGRAPWLLFLFGALLSCFAAPNLTECFDVHHFPDLIGLFILFQAVFFLSRSGRFVHLSATLVVAQLTLVSTYGVLQDLGIDRWVFEQLRMRSLYFQVPNNQAVSTLGNINFAGEYQVAAFPVALAMLLWARGRWSTAFFALAAVAADWNFVSQDTEGSNLGFFLALLVMVPLGIWIRPERAKRLLFFTAAGFGVEGVFTVFREWWIRSYSYLIVARHGDVVNLRDFNLDPAGREGLRELLKRYAAGREYLAEHWAGMASDIWVALGLAVALAVYYYGIPALGRRREEAGGKEWAARVRRRLCIAGAAVAVVAVLGGGPLYVRHSINATNEFLREGGEVRKHYYAEVQPDAEHPYTPGHFFLDTVLSSWTYVFRWECWQAASANLVDNSVPGVNVPLLGIGRGNFKVTHPLYASHLERKLLGAEVLARKVHNEWLAVGLEAGVFGILGQLWLYVVMLYCGYLAARRLRAAPGGAGGGPGGRFEYYFTLAAVGSLIGTGFQNTVSSNLLQPSSAVLTYWVGACVCALAVLRPVGARLDRSREQA